MKKVQIYISIAIVLLSGACTKGFEALNTNPTAASAAQFDPNLLLSGAENQYIGADGGYSGALLFQSMWAQIFASGAYPTYYSNGDKYVGSSSLTSYQASVWNGGYTGASYCYNIQTLVKGNAAQSNLSGISMIMELLNLQLVTDTYGDCPFSQALQAVSGVTHPAYDAQSAIYPSMLAKLDSTILTLDATKSAPTADLLPYKGSIPQWIKFGYSIMLRMAMRLTKVDPATAQTYAEKAYAGGVFASNTDNAYILFDHADGYSNNNNSRLQVPEDYVEVKWDKVLIDYLKSTNDPRLSVISEVPQPGLANAAIQSLAGNNTPALQQGMPNGYDQNGGATDITKAPGYPGPTGTGPDANPTGGYSRPTSALYIAYNTPGTILTYAQTEFLLAEAAARGWNVGASASTHYANALAATLATYATIGVVNGVGAISSGVINTYVAANPLDISSLTNSLAQINMQYWVATGTFFDFNEAWTNWRRSGYPVLTPVNYAGNFSNGTIPRRQEYPTSEAAYNPAAYNAAVAALSGGDQWTSRVWWDK